MVCSQTAFSLQMEICWMILLLVPKWTVTFEWSLFIGCHAVCTVCNCSLKIAFRYFLSSPHVSVVGILSGIMNAPNQWTCSFNFANERKLLNKKLTRRKGQGIAGISAGWTINRKRRLCACMVCVRVSLDDWTFAGKFEKERRENCTKVCLSTF